MNASNTNIRFNYLYRDAGNYKSFGCVIFSNPNFLPMEKLKPISSRLIDGEYFNHEKIAVPALFFLPENSDDHSWHEFQNVVETKDAPTDLRTIDEFLSSINF